MTPEVNSVDLVWLFSNLVGVAACYYLLAIYIPRRDDAMRQAAENREQMLQQLFTSERESFMHLVDRLSAEFRQTARSVDVLSGLIYQLLHQRPGQILTRQEIEKTIGDLKKGGATAAQVGFGQQG
jgi:TolA-binding protein